MSLAGGYDQHAFVAAFYDHVVPYRSRPDVTFFVDAARESGGRVLEVGCGSSRILIPAARAGVEVMGLDFSSHMLAVCRARLAQEPEAVRSRVELAHGDMRSFDLGKAFTLATVPFRPFQHLLTVDDQLSCLSRIRHHLIDGGRLILDIFNPSLDLLASDTGARNTGRSRNSKRQMAGAFFGGSERSHVTGSSKSTRLSSSTTLPIPMVVRSD